MILTSRAKFDFLKHCKQDESFMNMYDDIFLHALMISWFDSVGIFIHVNPITFDHATEFKASVNGEECSFGYGDYYFKSRPKAIKAAIEKANNIYNLSHS